jgi:transcriptional regulator with XRE-family HTH domain
MGPRPLAGDSKVPDGWPLELSTKENFVTHPGNGARLAAELRQLRERASVTQVRLAKALSVAPATISSWELKGPPPDRLNAYARLFAVPRALKTGKPISDADLTGDERESVRSLEEWLLTLGPAAPLRTGILTFEQGPVTVICPDVPQNSRGPLSETTNPNYTKLHRAADVDSLIELFGHVRACNPDLEVFYKLASEVDEEDLTSDIVALGGIGWNTVTAEIQEAISQVLPIKQEDDSSLDSGEVFASEDGKRFKPIWRDAGCKELKEDVAFLARLSNPYNLSRTLLICNGIHSRGVLGAVRCLTDTRVRKANEHWLAERFPDGQFALLLRVRVNEGRTMAPDLLNSHTRLYEWPTADEDLSTP